MSQQIVQDGLGELRMLADRIHTAITEAGRVPASAELMFDGDDIYWTVAYTHARTWPVDQAAQLLAAWRTERCAL